MTTKALQFILPVLLFPHSTAIAQCANSSNIYSFTHNGKNYEIVKELNTWADAAACAVQRGGYLAEINDQNEQLAVFNAIAAGGLSSTYTSIANGGGIAYLRLGATDQANEGTWKWDGNNDSNGIHFWSGQGAAGTGGGGSAGANYHNWGRKSTSTVQEPDNFGSGQHHGAITLAGWPSGTTALGIAGEWNDILGSSLLYFVIEKNSGAGLNDGINQSELKVYPNPSPDYIALKSSMNLTGANVHIYDITGNIAMINMCTNSSKINITDLNKGIYFLKIFNGSFTLITKFVKE